MARFHILTIGSATMDAFIRSSALEEYHDNNAPDGIGACFLMGSKMPAEELTFSVGGGATNAATTFARWGLETTCLTRLGGDLNGRAILEALRLEHIHTGYVQMDPSRLTGYSVILLSGTGHRAIFTHRGASAALDRRAFPWHHWTKKLTKTKIADWIYLTSLGGDIRALDDIFAYAERSGTRIAWNPGNKELEQGLPALKRYLQQAEILSINKEEADALGGFAKIADMPRAACLMTQGAKGASMRHLGRTLHAPALPGKRVNTTGAGDAFGSGFVASWIRTGDTRDALRDALLNATSVVSQMGAHAGILPHRPSVARRARVRIR